MKKIFLFGIVVAFFASCNSTKSLYSWYDYEDATYQYNKKRTDELKTKMMEQYLKLIKNRRVLARSYLLACMQSMAMPFIWVVKKKKV